MCYFENINNNLCWLRIFCDFIFLAPFEVYTIDSSTVGMLKAFPQVCVCVGEGVAVYDNNSTNCCLTRRDSHSHARCFCPLRPAPACSSFDPWTPWTPRPNHRGSRAFVVLIALYAALSSVSARWCLVLMQCVRVWVLVRGCVSAWGNTRTAAEISYLRFMKWNN